MLSIKDIKKRSDLLKLIPKEIREKYQYKFNQRGEQSGTIYFDFDRIEFKTKHGIINIPVKSITDIRKTSYDTVEIICGKIEFTFFGFLSNQNINIFITG